MEHITVWKSSLPWRIGRIWAGMWGRLLGTSYWNVAASWLSLGTYSSKDRFLGKAFHSPSPKPALWGSVVPFLPFLTVNPKTQGRCHLFHVAPLRMKHPWATHSCQGVRSGNNHEPALNSQHYGLESSFLSSFPSGHKLRDILNQQIKNEILKGAGKWILLSWALDQNSLLKNTQMRRRHYIRTTPWTPRE